MLGLAILGGQLLATVPIPGPGPSFDLSRRRDPGRADDLRRPLSCARSISASPASTPPPAARARFAPSAPGCAPATPAPRPPCLRAALEERLWRLSEAAGRALAAYRDEDADAAMTIAELGQGWYAFGAVGYWHGPTVNSAAAAGVFRLEGDRGEIPAASPDDCAFTLTRLRADRWRLAAHPPAAGGGCGGMNATVEGTYIRR